MGIKHDNGPDPKREALDGLALVLSQMHLDGYLCEGDVPSSILAAVEYGLVKRDNGPEELYVPTPVGWPLADLSEGPDARWTLKPQWRPKP